MKNTKRKKILREIRFCFCGCNFCKEVIVTSKWKYKSGHNPYPKIKREGRICKCGCGQTFECKVNSAKKFFSREHTFYYVNKMGLNKLNKHSWLKGLTKETDERVKNISNNMKGKFGKCWLGRKQTEEHKRKRLNKLLGRPLSIDRKNKISNTICKKYMNDTMHKNNSNFKHGYFYSSKNDKQLWYRSSYELLAYQLLESMVTVIKYKVEPFCIKYQYKNQNHRYIIDIYVEYINGEKQIIEIKPKYKLKFDQEQLKFEAANRFAYENGYTFIVWSEKELGIV
mgnify:CR=1 FL=1